MSKLIAAVSLRSRRFIRRCFSSGVSVISALSCCQISVLKRGRNREVDVLSWSSLHVAHHLTPSAWEKFSSVAELLSMVFVLTIEETKDPIRLSHVCQRWRDVALATPMLWTDISLCLSRVKGKEDMARFSAHLSCWLDRSGTCPISVCFLCGDRDPFIASLIELLMSHTRRWREVYFGVGLLQNTHPFLERLNSSTFPILEKLGLECTGSPQYSRQGGFVLDLSSLSNLSSFSLRADHDSTWLRLPSSLVELDIFDVSVQFLPDMIVPHLRSLALSTIPSIGEIFPNISHIFPCLEELEIHGEEYEIVVNPYVSGRVVFPSLTKLNLSKDALFLLHSMCTPHLTHLTLEYRRWNDELLGQVADFLWSSRCQESLVHMYISTELLDESYFIAILKAAPNLEVIETYNVEITDIVLAALTISPQKYATGHRIPGIRKPVLCPNLKEILFYSEWSGADPISVDVAISLILSRCHYQDVSYNTDEGEDQSARRPSLQRIQLPMNNEDIAKIKDDPRVQTASIGSEVWCGRRGDQTPWAC